MSQATVVKSKTNITKKSEIPTIQKSTDYSAFKVMKGNRTVDYNHVKRLKREMETNPGLMASSPILVNEHMFIIDGQHRHHAAQELGAPVYYIVKEGASIEATRHLNITQRRWTLLDFARSYADSGREDYVTFIRMVNEHPNVSPGIIRMYLAGGNRHDLDGSFRRGEFKVDDVDEARERLEILDKIVNKTKTRMNMPMALALLQLMRDNEDFDISHFMQKMDRDSARELYQPAASSRACFRSIEAVYNFQSKTLTRLY